VHHDVEIALFPDWIGKRLTRKFKIESERLALSFGEDVLEWKRKSGSDPDCSRCGDGNAVF
jgi:hypothetical protein